MKNIIENQIFSKERDLYNLKDTIVQNCKIEGEEDARNKENRSNINKKEMFLWQI